MGEFLSTPIKDKVIEDGENSYVYISYKKVSFCSRRYARMEKENGGRTYRGIECGY
jgi:hypothetical protein